MLSAPFFPPPPFFLSLLFSFFFFLFFIPVLLLSSRARDINSAQLRDIGANKLCINYAKGKGKGRGDTGCGWTIENFAGYLRHDLPFWFNVDLVATRRRWIIRCRSCLLCGKHRRLLWPIWFSNRLLSAPRRTDLPRSPCLFEQLSATRAASLPLFSWSSIYRRIDSCRVATPILDDFFSFSLRRQLKREGRNLSVFNSTRGQILP